MQINAVDDIIQVQKEREYYKFWKFYVIANKDYIIKVWKWNFEKK